MLDEIAIGKYQEKLHELLREMALSENTLWANTVSLSQYLERLRNIYSEDFHHQYSKLFDVVNSVFEDDDKDVSVFQENLKTFRNFIIEAHDEKLLKVFDKLRDHLSLEISRREHLKNQEDKMTDLKKNYIEMEDKAQKLEKSIDIFSERLSKMQTDFVAILAIFAAVVVAFSSGSNYMLSTLSAVSRAFTKEVVFIVLICGLMLMDTLFMLIYFIGSIIERHIGCKWWVAILANIAVISTLIWVSVH